MQRVADLCVEDAEGVSAGQFFGLPHKRLSPFLISIGHSEHS